MNEQREPSPTQESPAPQSDRTTVSLQEATVADADGRQVATGGQPDTEALAGDEPRAEMPKGLEPDTEALPVNEPGTGASSGVETDTEAPAGGIADNGPGATKTWTGTRVSRDRHVPLKMVLAGTHASPEQLARFSIES